METTLIINFSFSDFNHNGTADGSCSDMLLFQVTFLNINGDNYRLQTKQAEEIIDSLKSRGVQASVDQYDFLKFTLPAQVFIDPLHHIELRVK